MNKIVLLMISLFLSLENYGFQTHSVHSLAQAELALIEQDYKEALTQLRKTAINHPSDTIIQKRVFEVFEKIMTESKGKVNLDWELPESITRLRLQTQRKDNGKSYKISLKGNHRELLSVKQLRLTQFPERVLLDKSKGIGDWWEESDSLYGGGQYFELKSKNLKKPVQDGLYFIYLELSNGDKVDGWVFLNRGGTSSSNPIIDVPVRGQKFSNTIPFFQWQNFKSPEYKKFERRHLALFVSKSEAPKYSWDPYWLYFPGHARETKISYGDNKKTGLPPAKNLTPGRYVFILNYHESYQMGPITVQRTSRTRKPFHVE